MEKEIPRPLVILGGGQHGMLILDTCADAQIQVRGILEDKIPAGQSIYDTEVIGSFALLDDPLFIRNNDFIVALGNSQDGRLFWSREVVRRGGHLRTVVHPSASVSRRAQIGPGCYIKQQAVLLNDCRLGT